MAVDVLDPGPLGDFPHVPRDADGYLDTTRVPVGLAQQDGRLIDQTPTVRLPDGQLVPITDVVPVRPS